MIYTCRCSNGPAKGGEFFSFGPAIRVEIPYKGQILIYHLVMVFSNECEYQFRGLSEKENVTSDIDDTRPIGNFNAVNTKLQMETSENQ